MKKITLIKSLLGFSIIGGAFLTTTLTTNCGNPGSNTVYNEQGTNWEGYISGTLTCMLNENDKTCIISANNNYAANSTFTIPKTIVRDGVEYTITRVGQTAFRNSLIAGVNLNDVTIVDDRAFLNCKNLTKVNLGYVTQVAEQAFSGCDKLSQVDLNNVVVLGESAFASCPLSSVTVDPRNPIFTWFPTNHDIDDIHNGYLCKKEDVPHSRITAVCDDGGGIACGNIIIDASTATIGDYAFRDCAGVTSVDFNHVTTVGGEAFWNCEKLATVKLVSVTSFGSECFNSCPLNNITIDSQNPAFKRVGNNGQNCFIQNKNDDATLSSVCGTSGGIACGNITIPNTISIVDNAAFSACVGITNITCYATTINQRAFARCANLVSFICPPGLVTIGNYAFTECASLNSISLASVTTIGNYAFYKCTELTSAYLSVIVSLGNAAFQGCTNLRTLELGEDLTAIGNGAFGLCPLEDVQLQPTNTVFNWVGDRNNGFLQNADDETTLTPVCEEGGGIACGNIPIPSTITAISAYCFVSTMGMTSIDLSAPSALEFGPGWCNGCRKLSSVTIGASTTYTADQDEQWDDNVGADADQCFLYAPNNTVAENFKSDIIQDVSDKWEIIIQ